MTTTLPRLAPAPALEVIRALADPLRWRIVALLAAEQTPCGCWPTASTA